MSPATRALPIFLLSCQINEQIAVERRTIYPGNHLAVVETCKGAIAGALTKNDKKSEGEMSTEK